jgi:hypothetical protein
MEINDEIRAIRNCKRPDLPVLNNIQNKIRYDRPLYLGDHPDPTLQDVEIKMNSGKIRWKINDYEYPEYDLFENGCPQSYMGTRFVGSIVPYLSNQKMYDACEDHLIWEAVECFKSEQKRLQNYFDLKRFERMKSMESSR